MRSNVTHESEQIRRYLLGYIQEEDKLTEIEERMFSDEAYLEQIELAEDELIEEYLDNRLSATDGARFQRHFLESQSRRSRVELSRELRKMFEPKLPVRRASAPVWALAAAAVISVTFVGWLWTRSSLDKRTVESRSPASKQQITTLEDVRRLEGQWRAERSRAAELEKQLYELRAGNSSKVAPMLSFVLRPGVLRGEGAKKVPIRDGPSVVSFQLESDTHPQYRRLRVMLNRAQTREVWSYELPAKWPVTVTLPTSVLHDGQYLLTLSGLDDGGEDVVLHDYPFEVVRQ